MSQEKGLKNTTIGLMLGVALLFDGTQALVNLIPVAGQILSSLIDVFAVMTFWLWGRLQGFSFATKKRGATLVGAFLIEMIPILNILPAWTLAVIIFAADSKAKKAVSSIPGGNKVAGNISPKEPPQQPLDKAA